MAEVASAFVSLIPSARGFGSKLDGEISGQVNSSGKKAGLGFGRAFGVAAGALAGAGLVSFFKDAVSGASDLNESTTKISAIFGQAAGKVQKFADQGAQALGQTKLEVLDAAAQFGTFGKAAGLAGGDLAQFSTGFASLSTDLASFYNSSPEEAVQAIGAALRGEAEPIRRFGVLLDDATLRNEALKLGLIETTKQALTPQQKVLAAQAAIYKQTSDAQGDFQKTSGGLANQQRILAAQFSDLRTQLGTALLPAVTAVVTFVNSNVIPGIQSLAATFRNTSGSSGQFAKIIHTVVDAARSLFQWVSTSVVPAIQNALIPVLQRGKAEFAKLRASVQENRPQLQQLLNAFLSLANFVGTKVIPVLYKFQAQGLVNLVSAVRIVINILAAGVNAFNAIRSAITSGIEAAQKFSNGVQQKIGNAVDFIKAVPGKITAAIGDLGGLLVNAGRDVIQGLIDGIQQKVGALQAKLSSLTKMIPLKKGPPAKDKVLLRPAGQFIMSGLVDGITDGIKPLSKALENVGKKLKDKLQSARDGLKGKLDGLKTDFASLAGTVSSAFTGNLFEAATGSDFISNLMSTRAGLTNLLGAFKTLRGWGLDPAFLTQLFSSGNGGLILDLAGLGKTGALEAGALFGEVTSLSSQLGNAVAKNDPISDRIDVTNKKLDQVIDRLGGVGKDVGDAVNGAVTRGQKRRKNQGGK